MGGISRKYLDLAEHVMELSKMVKGLVDAKRA